MRDVLAAIRERAGGFTGVLGLWAARVPDRASAEAEGAIAWRAAETFPAASTLKLPILYEVFRQAEAGRFRLGDPLTVTADDVVPGSGVLKDLTPGLALPVRDLAALMIVVSDNTAANVLLDLVGIEAVNASMQALGLGATVIEHKFFRAPPGARSGRSSPQDLGRLMMLLARRAVLTPPACEEMLAILRRQHHTDQITRRMTDFDGFVERGAQPPVTVASKGGSIRGVRNEVALVERGGLRYVIAMMSRDCADRRFYADNEASLLLADVAALVDRHFRSAAGASGAAG